MRDTITINFRGFYAKVRFHDNSFEITCYNYKKSAGIVVGLQWLIYAIIFFLKWRSFISWIELGILILSNTILFYFLIEMFRPLISYSYWSRRFIVSDSDTNHDPNVFSITQWGLLTGFKEGREFILKDTAFDFIVKADDDRGNRFSTNIIVAKTTDNKIICMIDPKNYFKIGDSRSANAIRIINQIRKRFPKFTKIVEKPVVLENDLYLS